MKKASTTSCEALRALVCQKLHGGYEICARHKSRFGAHERRLKVYCAASKVNRSNVAVPQPVMAEITYGIRRLPKSKRRDVLQKRFDLLAGELARIAWTDSVSEHFGAVKASLERKGKRIEDFDAAMAAHALAENAVLVTANIDHMMRISGLKIEDWELTSKVVYDWAVS